jgi:hypothetical protein
MPTLVEGQLTVHEESIALLDALTNEDIGVSKAAVVRYVQRVARATIPPLDQAARVEPCGMTPWDWICSKNIALMRAASHDGAANAIMDLLQGMAVYAQVNGTSLDYVDVALASWTSDGRLVIEFKVGSSA